MFNKSSETKPIETIQDPNTGETIQRVAVSPDLVKDINKVMSLQNGRMQEFMANSQNYFAIQTRQLELFKQINDGDKSIKEAMQTTMKRAKLDPKLAWQWNLGLSCFEHRLPPVVPGMSVEEIKNMQKVGPKPTIISNPSVGIK